MLRSIYYLLDEADAVVHYNGTKFDIPTLNQEFISVGLTPPSSYKQIDLLRTTRGQFRFPSNKLDYVSRVLGLGQKLEHKGHDLWIGCMEGNQECWATMEKYNIQDVVLLEKLYNKLRPWIKNHPNVGLYAEVETAMCPVCGGSHLTKRGKAHTALGTYTRFRCNDCGKWSRSRKSEKTINKVPYTGI
jgi:DNA polymerase elongation subunit (family B)